MLSFSRLIRDASAQVPPLARAKGLANIVGIVIGFALGVTLMLALSFFLVRPVSAASTLYSSLSGPQSNAKLLALPLSGWSTMLKLTCSVCDQKQSIVA